MKTIIITGASRGIGQAAAKKFLNENWRVIGTYHSNPIEEENKNFVSLKLDQGSTQSIKEFVERLEEVMPKIDVLVNGAAVLLDAKDVDIDIEKLKKTFEVNIFGLVDLTERLLPLIGKGSHIINIDSTYGSFSFPINSQYSSSYRMSKAALNMYTRTLAFRLQERGIIVSSLDPGWVKTEMGLSVATKSEGPDREPKDVAEDVYNLVSTVTQSGQFWFGGEKRSW